LIGSRTWPGVDRRRYLLGGLNGSGLEIACMAGGIERERHGTGITSKERATRRHLHGRRVVLGAGQCGTPQEEGASGHGGYQQDLMEATGGQHGSSFK
jgi:hypothetical protein